VYLRDSRTPQDLGVIVQKIEPGSPAQKAGLEPEDQLLSYNGQEIMDVRRFIQLVQNSPIGSKAILDISRRGNPLKVTASVAARQAQKSSGKLAFNLSSVPGTQPGAGSEQPAKLRPLIGLETIVLTPSLADALQMPGQIGLLVVNVARQMPADLAGVLAGDVITAVEGEPIRDAPHFADYLESCSWGSQVEMKLIRKGKERSVIVKFPDTAK